MQPAREYAKAGRVVKVSAMKFEGQTMTREGAAPAEVSMSGIDVPAAERECLQFEDAAQRLRQIRS